MSSTGPTEGTLRVLPLLAELSAYVMLRPFFRPRSKTTVAAGGFSLNADDWEVDIDAPVFPGSGLGEKQFLRDETHPHLKLAKALISVPKVEPGDQVYCT